jgi:hypothetical protein
MRNFGTTSECVIHSSPSTLSISTQILNIRLSRPPSRHPLDSARTHPIPHVPYKLKWSHTPAPIQPAVPFPRCHFTFPATNHAAAARPGPPLTCHMCRAPASRQNSRIAAAVGVPLDDFNAMEMVSRRPPARSSPPPPAPRGDGLVRFGLPPGRSDTAELVDSPVKL